jgi:hypothetical protein
MTIRQILSPVQWKQLPYPLIQTPSFVYPPTYFRQVVVRNTVNLPFPNQALLGQSISKLVIQIHCTYMYKEYRRDNTSNQNEYKNPSCLNFIKSEVKYTKIKICNNLFLKHIVFSSKV